MTIGISGGQAYSARSACAPACFYFDLLHYLREHDRLFEVITYDDLPWGDDYDYRNDYPDEYRAWCRQLHGGDRDPDKIYIILQHDVDEIPERTMAFARVEQELGLPSNIMVFNQLVHGGVLREEGRVVFRNYQLDFNTLHNLVRCHGFVVGYHCNAFEQSGFDKTRAMAVFCEDVASLRKRLPIRYFSPHGGVRSQTDEPNSVLPIPKSLGRTLRWVQNRHGIRVDGHFCDAYTVRARTDIARKDLVRFISACKRGGRYRISLHPQYYDQAFKPLDELLQFPWYGEMIGPYLGGAGSGAWAACPLPDGRLTIPEDARNP